MKVVSLVFLWGKMRTIAQETASQLVLRNCVKEVGGKVSICDFGEGEEHAINEAYTAIQLSRYFFNVWYACVYCSRQPSDLLMFHHKIFKTL